MRVAILARPGDLSAYVEEFFRAWGLALQERVTPAEAAALDPAEIPVLLCPAGEELSGRTAGALEEYAARGGTLFCVLPDGALAAAAGLMPGGAMAGPLRLRVSDAPDVGLAGEPIPVVGRAVAYTRVPETRALASLSRPGQYEGERPAVIERRAGAGRIVAFAFDLPLCVLLLRQGDPARAERLPASDACARPSHLAADLGPGAPGWLPYADLLARLPVEWVREAFPAPAPLLSHLPGPAPGILLYSGDEDRAPVAANDAQLEILAAAGARMNLYIAPRSVLRAPRECQRRRNKEHGAWSAERGARSREGA